ncbi:MAG: ribosome maturation factor RimP [Humidesulfovibrio sp.]|uniref:ribosome maturation factor RimP n=1 Tax=Humidesulfovibrio sp. TaxID=2910988 RepID=UPI0027EED60A|nr:ribosome maturation factor RimP [Humidesulfovibrio sp.]MDQ7833875.1 ribosome maturation factor RimP [Humidesulfovibrio sp.]
MTKTPLAERLTGIIGPAVRTLGVELWGVEFASAGSRMVVRVYIDAPATTGPAEPPMQTEGEGEAGLDGQEQRTGVTIAMCAKVSRHLGTVLEAEDAVPGAYVLEVSSPGLERRFFNTEQLEAYIGHTVDVRLHQPQDGRRHLRGILAEVGADAFVVDENDVRIRIMWPHVKIAHLVHEFPGAAA